MKCLLQTRRGENAETHLKLLTKQEQEQTFELSKEDGTCGRGVEEKDESLVLLFMFKGLN